MKMFTKTKRIGGSLMVVIPKKIVEEQKLIENQTVEIDVKKPKRLWGICKGIGSWIREEDRPHDHRDD